MLACLYLKNAVRFELENVKELSEAERVEVTALREVKSQKSKVKKGYRASEFIYREIKNVFRAA